MYDSCNLCLCFFLNAGKLQYQTVNQKDRVIRFTSLLAAITLPPQVCTTQESTIERWI